jgi:hypothetical protein
MSGSNPVLRVHGEMERVVEISDSVVDTTTPERRLLHDVVREIVPQKMVRRHDPVIVGP